MTIQKENVKYKELEKGLHKAGILLELNITTFDTIGFLVQNIKNKIEEAKAENDSDSMYLSLITLTNFCLHIEEEIDKAVNFYNIKE